VRSTTCTRISFKILPELPAAATERPADVTTLACGAHPGIRDGRPIEHQDAKPPEHPTLRLSSASQTKMAFEIEFRQMPLTILQSLQMVMSGEQDR
jgi:hypothetical protein